MEVAGRIEISVQGYSFVKKNITRHGGGVLLYVYNELTRLTGGDVESVWIKVRHRNESLALGVMYRPPATCLTNSIIFVL